MAKGSFLATATDELEAMYRTNSLAPARIAHALLRLLPHKIAIGIAGYGMKRAIGNSANVR